jgi:hypothetical protein
MVILETLLSFGVGKELVKEGSLEHVDNVDDKRYFLQC